MRKKIQHSIMLIAAIAVFFTGTGVTVMNYCCSGCMYEFLTLNTKSCCLPAAEVADIAKANNPDCCTNHASSDMLLHDDCADKQAADGKHCSASRMSIDIDSSMSKTHTIVPFTWLSNIIFSTVNIVSSQADYADEVDYTASPPLMSPRTYLSLIRVLII